MGDIVILDCDENKIDSPFDDVHMLPNDIVSITVDPIYSEQKVAQNGAAKSVHLCRVFTINVFNLTIN